MNPELVNAVAYAFYGPAWWQACGESKRNPTRRHAVEGSQAAIKAVGDYLVNALPDDSADDVRGVLGL